MARSGLERSGVAVKARSRSHTTKETVRRRYTRRKTSGLDGLGSKIIALLRQNGRMSNAEIARRLGIPEVTARRKVQRLLAQQIIAIVALTNPIAIGYTIDTHIAIQVGGGKAFDVANRLATLEEVRYVGITTGAVDIIIAAMFRDNNHLLDFVANRLGTVEGIVKTETFHVLKVVKRTYDYVWIGDGSAQPDGRDVPGSRVQK